jgi:hypothetical protein
MVGEVLEIVRDLARRPNRDRRISPGLFEKALLELAARGEARGHADVHGVAEAVVGPPHVAGTGSVDEKGA